MKSVVVYESLWGNTAKVARAIAKGLGQGSHVITPDALTPDLMQNVDLIVAGAPVLGFALPGETIRDSISKDSKHADNPADLSHPSLRSGLEKLERGSGKCAAFETRIWWSPRGSAPTALKMMRSQGYEPVSNVSSTEKFIVEDTYGPLKDGELDRARAWGEALAETMTTSQ